MSDKSPLKYKAGTRVLLAMEKCVVGTLKEDVDELGEHDMALGRLSDAG